MNLTEQEEETDVLMGAVTFQADDACCQSQQAGMRAQAT